MSAAKKLLKLDLKHYTYGDGRVAWFLVGDPVAGSRRVYTVYRITLTGDKRARVIGRELDLATARDVVRRDMQSCQELPS